MRVVVDTNIWISYLLRPSGALKMTVTALSSKATILYSTATMDELLGVLERPKFRRYLSRQTGLEFVTRLTADAEYVEITEAIKACPDPDDDKFLELAVAGNADIIVTGDSDLLDLHPFRHIDILTPRDTLARLS
ncbi:MAG: putative toxin-antitoxin system toxin component, PIN family [Sphingomonadales bacterium]|nr:putative toxin-antitoxin system toxin component, PIN family [Sphingomonadales bacterium]